MTKDDIFSVDWTDVNGNSGRSLCMTMDTINDLLNELSSEVIEEESHDIVVEYAEDLFKLVTEIEND